MKILAKLVILSVLVNLVTAGDVYAKASVVGKLTSIEPRQVKVGGEIGRRIENTVNGNVLSLDVDGNFLQPFINKTMHGGSFSNKGNYVGLGKFIDALAYFAAYTNDERVLAMRKHVLDVIIANQQADGYIGLLVPESRMSKLWDIHEMSYIVFGLTRDYKCFGEKRSLEAAQSAMDYMIANWSKAIKWTHGYAGLELAAMTLYRETGERRYLEFCLKQRKLADWNVPIRLGRWYKDNVPVGHHAYAYMLVCLAQLELYHVQPEEKLLRQARGVIDFLTKEDGMLITGTVGGEHESWGNDQDGSSKTLTETCATTYLIRLLDSLLRLEGNSLYGDHMERIVYNALFADQSPDGQNIRYYCPLYGKRYYFPIATSCCPNNFRRIMANLPELIYYLSDDGLAINFYTPSTTKVELACGVPLKVRQETDYPNSGNVAIYVNPSKSAKFSLKLRIPRWCEKAQVAVNGKRIDKVIKSGSFFVIERKWQAGDKVELKMPMSLRLVKGRRTQYGRVAVMRGPMLFCLNPELNGAVAGLDMHELTIDPGSLEGPFPDKTVRPDGMAVHLRAWPRFDPPDGTDLRAPEQPAELPLVLTEFTDPGGQIIYFRLHGVHFDGKYYGDHDVANLNMIVDDELVQVRTVK